MDLAQETLQGCCKKNLWICFWTEVSHLVLTFYLNQGVKWLENGQCTGNSSLCNKLLTWVSVICEERNVWGELLFIQELYRLSLNWYIDRKDVRRNSQALLIESFSKPGINPENTLQACTRLHLWRNSISKANLRLLQIQKNKSDEAGWLNTWLSLYPGPYLQCSTS